MDWSDHSHAPHQPRRTDTAVEDLVLQTRSALAHGDLGAIGAASIRQALQEQGVAPLPSLRTINRILARRGALDGRRRTRRPPPPRGWYLPEVATAQAELDSFDIVEGLVIKDGPQIEVLNGVSLHGGLVVSWPTLSPVTAEMTVQSLVEHWRLVGLPGYAQFDNDMIFQGTHRYPDALGRIIRVCLSLDVTPVFVPPRETGFQAMIESYNGWWQAKVWSRFTFTTPGQVRQQSDRFVAAVRPLLGADRYGPVPSGLPHAVAVGPAGPSSRSHHLRAAHGWRRGGAVAGTELRGRSAMGQPPGPRRSSISTLARSASTPCVGRSRRSSPCFGR